MQESIVAQSIAGSVRKTLTKLEAYHDEIDKKENSLEKIRILTQNLESYEEEIDRSLSAIDWMERNKECRLSFDHSSDEWVVFVGPCEIGRGGDIVSALESAYRSES